MHCGACNRGNAAEGWLCFSCTRRLPVDESLLPEHIVWREPGRETACLFDAWGRLYRLRNPTAIGRGESNDLVVLSSAISRLHAALRREKSGWILVDEGSRNGTYCNDERVRGRVSLAPRDVLRIGNTGFLFALAADCSADAEELLDVTTASFPSAEGACGESEWFRLHRRSQDAVGLLQMGGHLIELTAIQCDLLSLLRERHAQDRSEAAPVRGFVSSAELVSRIAWETAYPNEAHLVQLVRRLRARLSATSLEIEARRGLGYRLRIPTSDGLGS